MTGQDTQMQGQPISMGAHVSTTLTTSDFDYDLPEELIAQTPVEPRDASRLMVMDTRGRYHTMCFPKLRTCFRREMYSSSTILK